MIEIFEDRKSRATGSAAEIDFTEGFTAVTGRDWRGKERAAWGARHAFGRQDAERRPWAAIPTLAG